MSQLPFRLACVLLCSALLPAQDGKPPAPKFPVGVVDFQKVFEAYPRAIEEKGKLEEFKARRQAELDAEERKLEVLKAQRDNFKQGSTEYALKSLELRSLLQRLEGMQEVFRNEMGHKRDEFANKMFGDVERAIRIVAKERGLLLVLRQQAALDGLGPAQQAQLYEGRQLWYAAEEIDLTPAIIKLLQVPLPELPKASDAKGAAPKPSNEKPAGGV